MREDDLPAVGEIAAQLHPAYPEDGRIFAERLQLYPNGCLVLEMNDSVLGYVISHPWRHRQPPTLNSLLQILPVRPSTYYIHDVALLPTARGLGAVTQLMSRLSRIAQDDGLLTLSLVAVNGSREFWSRQGFVAIDDPALEEKLNSYDLAARFLCKDLAAS
ncbi:GNAT family N-acetyltransferase [Herminiimonas aquatilis]|uniref:GNAT family N-acetyltransferase n=1 Tax=Herminiimonas aquatilis TaxID=345342 RepID=A0ABW2J827_9BURK